jgi:hypothetical protein
MAGAGRREADELLAAHLAGGLTLTQAAEKAGVAERTARRRAKEPAFRRRVEELKAEAVGRAVGVLGRSMTGAAVELAKLLKSADEKTRLQAAREIIGLTLRARQQTELERRMAELEDALKEDGGGAGGPTDEAGSAGGSPAGPVGSDA